jgi:phytoene dehydrogenase-like protein
MMFGSWKERVSTFPRLIKLSRYFKYTLGSYSRKFKNPALRSAISSLHYAVPQFPLFGQLLKEGNVAAGGVSWPVGGAITLAENMALQYQQSGGTIQYSKKVVKILTKDDKACGVKLEDGTEHTADFVVSNVDGRKTIMQMLSGKYINRKISRYYQPNQIDDLEFAVLIFLGVKRDLSSYPPASVIYLEEPDTICGLACQHLDIQTYGYDSSMAPPGKGVIKVELRARPSYFSSMIQDKDAYQSEKMKIADQVINLLENKWSGVKASVEVVDVVTLHTWERFMGGTNGWPNWPNKKFSIMSDIFGFGDRYTLPGLKNFYFAGQWATSAGALLMNAISGKTVIKKICKQNGTRFS